MNKPLTPAQANHLRRLLGYIRCEIWQSPEEYLRTIQQISHALGEPSDEQKAVMLKDYEKSCAVPKYVRDALKALEIVVKEQCGEVVDAEQSQAKIEA